MKSNKTLTTEYIENDSTTRVHTTRTKRKTTSSNKHALYGVWLEQGYNEDGSENNSNIFISTCDIDKTIALLMKAQQTIKEDRDE